MVSFPLAVQTAYQDLLDTHKTRMVSDLGGTPFLRNQGAQGSYWYARQRVGDRVVDRYIGRDSAELRERIAKARETLEDQKQFDRRCASLVAQLRAAGLPALDRDTGKVLNAMARVGTFRLGATLVGTHAFRLYSAELGVRLEDRLAVTQDVDIAAFENLKLVIDDEVDPSLAKTFKELNFSPAPGLDQKHRPTRWAMQGGGTMVDFLAPRMREAADTLLLAPLGVYAQALFYLNFLIADPIPAAGLYRNGILVQIPRPERYAIHKLIVAQQRIGDLQAKARKDLAQADVLIRGLAEDRPFALAEAYEKGINTGPKWKNAIDRSLSQRPEIAAILSAVC